MKPVIYNYAPSNTSFVALTQGGTSGVSLTLNPSTFDYTNIALSQVILDSRQSKRVASLTSTGDASSIQFTIAGLDFAGSGVTQTITGPNAGTVYTTTGYTLIQSIIPNGTFTTGVAAGFGTTGASHWFIPSQYTPGDFNVGIGIYVSGTITYTIQHTFDDIFNTSLNNLRTMNCDDTAVVTATSTKDTNYAFGVGAIRNSITGTGTGGVTTIFRQSWV